MKNSIQYVFLSLIILFCVSSCSIEKRKYTRGYYIPGAHAFQKPKPKTITTLSTADAGTITPTIPESKLEEALRESETDDITEVPGDSCDKILLIDGSILKVNVTSITRDDILYKECSENGKEFWVAKAKVSNIIYQDGKAPLSETKVTEQMATTPPPTPAAVTTIDLNTAIEETPVKQKFDWFSVTSLFFSVLAYLFFFAFIASDFELIALFATGIVALIALGIGIFSVIRTRGRRPKFWGKGFALAGMIGGIVFTAISAFVLYLYALFDQTIY